MASRPFAISPLSRATATVLRPPDRCARVIRRQASSPDCRIASASTPGGALRSTNLRSDRVTSLRSWLVFGAVAFVVLREPPDAELEAEPEAGPDGAADLAPGAVSEVALLVGPPPAPAGADP